MQLELTVLAFIIITITFLSWRKKGQLGLSNNNNNDKQTSPFRPIHLSFRQCQKGKGDNIDNH